MIILFRSAVQNSNYKYQLTASSARVCCSFCVCVS